MKANDTTIRLQCLQIAASRFTPSATVEEVTAEAERLIGWATKRQKRAARPKLAKVTALRKAGGRPAKKAAAKA